MRKAHTAVVIASLCVLCAASPSLSASLDDRVEEARRLYHSGEHEEAIEILENEILPLDIELEHGTRVRALELLAVAKEMTEDDAGAADAWELRWLSLVSKLGSDHITTVNQVPAIAYAMNRAGRHSKSRYYWTLYLGTGQRSGYGDSSLIDEVDAKFHIARSYAAESRPESWKKSDEWYRKALEHDDMSLRMRGVMMLERADVKEKLREIAEAQEIRDKANRMLEEDKRLRAADPSSVP